ncbi:uncharacterized protein LOC113329808 [Papaver somniferum]|uniref:uncharacterized protein LOC113329808 n=1 Tax=Papaver somniferum TaxID=3469 RepID=UPI000E6F6C7F|nr:uncharacterized protein LOC113329808 [Papaver somniferum]
MDNFDGMEHDLAEEGEHFAKDNSHGMVEAPASLENFSANSNFLHLIHFKVFNISLNMKILSWNDQGYCNHVNINRVGLAGGLILMWKDEIHCEIQHISNNMIHVITRLDPSKPEVLISFMYGSTYFNKKKDQWDLMMQISENIMQPWLIVGDLNLHLHDTSEASSFSTEDRYVQEKMNICGFMDIGYTVQAGSDHCPIMLIPKETTSNTWRPFKFFVMWMKHFAFRNQLQIAWNTNVNGFVAFNLTNKQQRTRKILSYWNKIEFGNIDRNINNLQTQLEIAQNDSSYNSQRDNIVAITKKLDDWFNIKEDFYKQKSGDSFITEMDHNTKYFHTLDNIRMSRKNIDCLCDANDVWFSDSKDIANLLVDHISQVSKTTKPVFTDIIPTIIIDHDNSFLTRIPNSDEIHQIIKHMSAWSSPGPDGFQEGFYQHNWDIVGKDITTVVQSFFETGHMPKEFNKTYLSLIPKTDNAKRPVDFRPIGILRQFSFDAKFCGYIEQCISTTTIYVLLKGSPTESFSPTRGIRQGDPLSPYLFILRMEFLSRFLLNAETSHLISSVKAARKAPGITHLMFADDILIFTKADMHNIEGIMSVLDYFSSV